MTPNNPGTMVTLLAIFGLFSLNNIFSAHGFVQPTTHSSLSRPLASSRATKASFLSASTLDEPTIRVEEEPAQDSDTFDWFQSWYPVVAVDSLDPEKPHAFQLLGMDVVIWNDGPVLDKQGNVIGEYGSKKDRPRGARKNAAPEHWKAMVDSCPHRRVPLSEGRVEDDGSLLCSYHAWRFDGEGKLIDVPSCTSGEVEKLQTNSKSHCQSFPTQVVDGLLWVWAEASPDAALKAALTPLPRMKLPHEVDERVQEYQVKTLDWNWRELPYGHDFFIENVVDPAHVPVSHHNVVGNRYKDPKPSRMKLLTPMTKNGFDMLANGVVNATSFTNFTAPCTVGIETIFADGARQYLELYSSPSRPGFSNHVGRLVLVTDSSGKVSSFLKPFALPLPKFLRHVTSSLFLNQDALFLHHQERAMHRHNLYSTTPTVSSMGEQVKQVKGDYNDAVVPHPADKGVLNFRRWMQSKAGGVIPFRGDTNMPPPSNDVVFDIYNSHTAKCHVCQTAIKRIKRVRLLAFCLAATMAVLRPLPNKILSLLSVGILGGIGMGSNKFLGMFRRVDFSHAQND